MALQLQCVAQRNRPHALAGIEHLAKVLPKGAHILVNLSGRGDKDMETAARYFGLI